MVGKYRTRFFTEDGHLVLMFELDDLEAKAETDELREGAEYELTVTKPRRSLDQNRLLWLLIGKISKKLCEDKEVTYRNLLIRGKAKSDVLAVKKDALDALREKMRYVEILGQAPGGQLFVRAYYGSSEMNTAEMGYLIDLALEWCAELDIPVRQNMY